MTARRKASKNVKKRGNIICRELYHEGVSALNDTAPTLSRALSFQSLFMAAFATDLVAIFNEEHALLLRKLFQNPCVCADADLALNATGEKKSRKWPK